MSLKESISLLMQKVDGLSAAVAAAIKSVAANSGGSGGGLSLPIGTIISYSALKGATPAGCLALSQTRPTVVNTTEYPELIGMYSGGNVQIPIVAANVTTDSPVLNGWSPALCFDGTTTTAYHSTSITMPRTITIPLGASAKTISRIEYQQRSAGGQGDFPVQLQVSTDGVLWSNVGTVQTILNSANALTSYDIPANIRMACKFARLYIIAKGYAVIGEIRLFENAAGSVVIPAQPMNVGQAPFIYIGR